MLEQLAEKMKVLKGVVVSVEKQFGKGSIMALGDEGSLEAVPTIPTGSLALDLATGVGGYPRGRVVEIYGPESSGKTTLSLHAIAQAQRGGGVCAFIDAEHAFDVAYARSVGVETDKLLVSQPDTGEQALDIVDILVRSGAVDLVVVDSVAALVPRAEIEGEMGDSHMGLQARLMSQALRKLTAIAHRTNTTIMFINQLRQKIGVTFGNPETTTGGNALKFYASMRLDVRRIGQVKVGDELVGGRTRVKLAKNKMAPPFCEAEFEIRYGRGVDVLSELIDLGLARGLVEKNGNHLAFAGTTLGNGRERSRETIASSIELQTTLRQAILASGPVRPGRRADGEA
ncbi:MAG: recombinase RecA [Labilithrix sp.]|nr:recombinase RecA [Labilithrix sp.]MBX3222724.1 recombinase RecA [Labilithrix sp.]